MAKFKVQGVNLQNIFSSTTVNYSTSGVPLTGSVETAGRGGMPSPSIYEQQLSAGPSFVQQLNGYSGRRGLYLYKNIPPAISDILGYGATVGTSILNGMPATFRAADLLLTYNVTAVTFTGNTIALALAQATAAASGTATWFCLATYNTYVNTTNKFYPCMIVGTITPTNNGGDIEMPNVSIISGNIYKMPQLELKLPFSYTV